MYVCSLTKYSYDELLFVFHLCDHIGGESSFTSHSDRGNFIDRRADPDKEVLW